MSHLDILLPFALPPSEISRDLLRELNTPALASLLSRTKSSSRNVAVETFEGFRRALPHETWLARTFDVEGESSPRIAPDLMRSFRLPQQEGIWFVVQPVHIHVAQDHLALTDWRQLQLAETEAEALFAIAQKLFAETGKTLLYGDANTWFVRADEWEQLHTASPDTAGGRNIDIWIPSGPGERDWRKIQNEVQMHWFTHAINAEREIRGMKTVNSIWLWGGGSATSAQTSAYTEAFNLGEWTQAFTTRVTRHSRADSANQALSGAVQHGFVYLDTLTEYALSTDWARWLNEMHALEAAWFAPLLDALKSGKLSSLDIVATNDTRLAQFAVTRSSLRKFWVSPSLAPLARFAS